MLKEETINILLIDDDLVDRKLFKRLLQASSLNYELTEAATAQEAFEILKTGHFNCIWLDFRLPGTDGFEVITTLAKMECNIPVAILTSYGDETLAVELLQHGAVDYCNKNDISTERIERTVQLAMRIHQAEIEKAQAIIQLESIAANTESVIQSTNAIIFALNKKLEVTVINNAAKQFFIEQYGSNVEQGFNLQNLNLPEDAPIRLRIREAFTGKSFVFDEEYGHTAYDKRYFETSYNPIFGNNKQLIGITIFAKDVTENRHAKIALLKAKNEALKTAEAKSAFLSNMSHEIRTPMNAIIGITDLLLEKVKEENVIKDLKSIKFSADNLLFLINDILDYNKIEAGKIELESITFSLQNLLHDILKTFRYKSEEKGLTLLLQINHDVPDYIIGDPYRLNQILFNLIGNAIKFTKEGNVQVKVEVKRQLLNKFELRFSVKDSGIGIASDKLDNIFDSFTQAYTNTARKYGGSGLGLAITKNLVEMQHGQIGVSSTLGEGSLFYVDLNYQSAEPASVLQNHQQLKKEEVDYSIIENKRLLLVEDNSINQFVAQQILKKVKADVVTAENGIEAIQLLRKQSFDLVLMDLHMPEMNGYEATEAIRSGIEGIEASIPIIALTADAFDETRTHVIRSGMNDFVTKPFKQEELFNKIIKHLAS
ncbi:MAG: response regulator [Bacteroidia bacterium]|jgi:signal transduction histidine kinase|nr:response regulator [Bacteroidia bacterium]